LRGDVAFDVLIAAGASPRARFELQSMLIAS
jgi:hypothetical protein